MNPRLGQSELRANHPPPYASGAQQIAPGHGKQRHQWLCKAPVSLEDNSPGTGPMPGIVVALVSIAMPSELQRP